MNPLVKCCAMCVSLCVFVAQTYSVIESSNSSDRSASRQTRWNLAQQSESWVRKAGSEFHDDAGYDVVADERGHVMVTGAFAGLAIFGTDTLRSQGQADIFLAKYDSSGRLLWIKRTGGLGNDIGRGIATDGSGSIFVAGTFEESLPFGADTLKSTEDSDIFIAKLDSLGNILWTRQGGGESHDEITGIATDHTGNVFIIGNFSRPVRFDTVTLINSPDRHADIFIIKYNGAGDLLWAEKAGGPGADIGNGIATDSFGNVFITGKFLDEVNFDTIRVQGWNSYHDDAFIAKYSSAGQAIWADAKRRQYASNCRRRAKS